MMGEECEWSVVLVGSSGSGVGKSFIMDGM